MTRGSRTRCTCRSPGIGSREARSTRRSRSSELRFPHAFPKTCGNSTGDLLDLPDTCGILDYRLGRHVAHRGAGPWRDCLLLKSFDLHVVSISHAYILRINLILPIAPVENANAG